MRTRSAAPPISRQQAASHTCDVGAVPLAVIPLRHALGCCGSDRHLLSRFAAELLDELAHTRSARKGHLALLDHPHAAPLGIAAPTTADVFADGPTGPAAPRLLSASFRRPTSSIEIGAAAPSGGLDHVGFSQEARGARAVRRRIPSLLGRARLFAIGDRRRPAGARRGSTPWTQCIGTASATVRSGEDGAPTPSLAQCATSSAATLLSIRAGATC